MSAPFLLPSLLKVNPKLFFSSPPLHASYSEPVVLAIVGGSSEQETEPKV